MSILRSMHKFLESFHNLDFIGLFLIRLYLFNIMWFAGTEKIENIDKFSGWLGTLGVPFSEIMIWLLIVAETGAAALLLVGLFVRWASVPLIITMFFYGYFIHLDNGWSLESNGIELTATYGLMLLILLFMGGGRYLSLDYWVSERK